MNKTVARRYALALFKLVRPEDVDTALSGLDSLNQSIKGSNQLKHVLASPVFTLEAKAAVLTACCQKVACPPGVDRFCAQLLKKNRVKILPEIVESFHQLIDEDRRKQPVSLLSATDLGKDTQLQIQTTLQSVLKRDVALSYSTDPSLFSGIQIRIGSKVYDSSVKGRLEKMRAQLVKG